MNIRAMILAGLLGLPFVAGAAGAAEATHPSLAEAARIGDREAVRSMLSGGADKAGATAALIWAAYRNDLEMADLLLRAGADVKGANEYGATALYAAATNADPAMAEKLLAAGADANAQLLSGETSLMEASRRGNLAAVRLLLAAGANPDAQEVNGGQTALMWATSQRHPAVTQELVQHKADVGKRSKRGSTALMFAAQQGDTESARILIGAGAKANDVMPTTGWTPLLVASAMGRGKVVTLLLDNGADLNAFDAEGFTSLHYAAKRKGSVAMISALLAHGAEPNVHLIQKKVSAVYVSGVFLQGGTPLALAAEINNLDAVKALVAAGADPRIPTELGTTPLMLAAGAGTDVSRARPLEERAMAVQTVRFLVDQGVDVNAHGQFGWTALHAAAYQGLDDVIEYLAGKGADLEAQDGFGQTPLSVASAVVTKGLGAAYYQTARSYHADTVKLLLRLGAIPLERSGVVIVNHRATE